MVDGNAPLSAAERRERRLKRILGDGENRIKRILSGPSGDEQRLPPMLEGGEFGFPILSSNEEASTATDVQDSTDTLLLNIPPNSRTFRVLSSIQRMDASLCLLYGICVRIFMLNWKTFNILLPWVLLFFGARLVAFVREGPKFVAELKDFMRSKDLSAVESLLRRSYSALAVVHVFASRLVLVLAAFLVAHAAVTFSYGT